MEHFGVYKMSVHVCIRTGSRCNHCVHGLARGHGSVLSVQTLGICVYQCVLTGGVQQPACSVVLHVLVEALACLVVRTHSEAQQSEQRCETTERTPLLSQFGKCPVT
jgi:hypothetical protein